MNNEQVTQLAPADALATIERIYVELGDLQAHGYRFGDDLHGVPDLTWHLEGAITDLGAAMVALHKHLGTI